MKFAHFDPFSGVAGDMTLAALHDAGCPIEIFASLPERLGLSGVAVRPEAVTRHGLRAVQIHVDISVEDKGHRHLADIERILAAAHLPERVKRDAGRVFQRLAEAEAAVHGCTVQEVHFHEVGALDAIVDIVGACAGLDALGVERVTCGPLPPGSGSVTCEHGVMPVPAPATAQLLRGVPTVACPEPGELVTPTGAALMTTLAADFGDQPAMRIEQVGTGTGTRVGRTRPNILRVFIGTGVGGVQDEVSCLETISVLESQVDDAAGQELAFAVERLWAAGAVDVWMTPIMMKKGRPGQLVSVLCRPTDAAALTRLILRETPTLGVRVRESSRWTLPRETVSVVTRFGTIRVKVATRPDGTARGWPEYEDCASAARAAEVTLREVQAAAMQAWERQDATNGGESG